MGSKCKCARCGAESFVVYMNSYNDEIIPQKHYEIVCTKCSYGSVMVNLPEIWKSDSPIPLGSQTTGKQHSEENNGQ